MQVDLSEANLYGANLTEANLTGANLTRANLREARLDLRRAKRSGADFSEANLSGIVDEGSLPRPAGAEEPAVETLPRVAVEPGPDRGALPRAPEAKRDDES